MTHQLIYYTFHSDLLLAKLKSTHKNSEILLDRRYDERLIFN